MDAEHQRAHVCNASNRHTTRRTKRTCRSFKKKTSLKKTHKCLIIIPNTIWEMYNHSTEWPNLAPIMSNIITNHKCIRRQDPTSTKNLLWDIKTSIHLCQHQWQIPVIRHNIRGAIITWIDNHSSDKYDCKNTE